MCLVEKPITVFVERHGDRLSKRLVCSSCEYKSLGKERRERWKKENPGLNKMAYTRYNWKKRGIVFESEEDFEYWWNRYNTATHCEVTGEPFKDNKLDVKCLDHDHKTGKPRGVIIGWLNLALSRMEDPAIYHKIGEYLEHK